MKAPDMNNLAKWIGQDTIEEITEGRKKSGEVKREGKFSTIRVFWLSLFVAHSGKSSLYDIVQTALSQQRTVRTLSVSGFCKARARFSPKVV